jgi:hypothetical protein
VRGRVEKWCGKRQGSGAFYRWKRGGKGPLKAVGSFGGGGQLLKLSGALGAAVPGGEGARR